MKIFLTLNLKYFFHECVKKLHVNILKKYFVTQAISQTGLCQVKGEKESCTTAAKHKLLTARRGRAKTINLMIFFTTSNFFITQFGNQTQNTTQVNQMILYYTNF